MNYGIYNNNPSAREIIRRAVDLGGLPKNKYNFPLHCRTEELTGELSDRTAYDVGSEMQK